MVTKRKGVTKHDTKTDITPPMSVCEAMQISIRMGVFIALALFLLTGVWGIHRYLHLSQRPAEMSFTGTDEQLVPNSTAEITFSFSDLQKDVSLARDAVTTQAEKAYAALAQLDGIYENDVQTTGYIIYPEYEHSSSETLLRDVEHESPELLGYRVTHTTTVTVRDINRLGTILTLLTDFGPETITGPLFIPDEKTKSYAEEYAVAQAITKARTQAHTIAHISGLRLKRIVRINVYDDDPSPLYRQKSLTTTFDDALPSKAVPIQPGEQSIRKTAVISYEIEE